MRTNQYMADSQGIGDWAGNEEAAIKRWNTYIGPQLRSAHEAREEAGEDAELLTGYDADWAWTEFCGRSAGDSEEETKKLAEELRERLS